MLYVPQACRALACLLVAVDHGAGLIGHHHGVMPLFGLSEFGFSGVHLFFVISGLIIYHAHRHDLDDPKAAPRYLLKRFVRIYPFYWIVFLALGGRWVFTDRMGIGEFLTNALLFSSTKKLVVSVSWTLAYEMIFYGLFVAFLIKRNLGIAVFAAWFASIALNHHYHFAESIALDVINLLFLLGLLTAIAVSALRSRLESGRRDQIAIVSLIAGAVTFLYTAWVCLSLPARDIGVWRSLPLTLGFGTGAALLLFASVSEKVEEFLKRQRLLLLIGDASYSIYLVHFYVQKRTGNAIRSLGWVPSGEITQTTALLLLAVTLLVSVGGGILIHKAIEKPVLARCRKWLGLGAGVR